MSENTNQQKRGLLVSITTDDQWDFDPIIISILISVLLVSLFTGYDMLHNHATFDPEKFGNGIAFILGAGGAGYGAKRFGERSHRDASNSDVPQS